MTERTDRGSSAELGRTQVFGRRDGTLGSGVQEDSRAVAASSDHEAFVIRMRTRLLDALRSDLEGQPDRWVVLDFPSQLNCGDSAIWLGEAAAARALGARVVRAVDRRNAVALVGAGADRLVLLHGGGNFGGLYPSHEELRLRALRTLRGRRLVQLPQSVEWASEQARETMKRAVGEHGDLLLYVRDERSYDRAVADLDCEVRLVPDAAFALGPLERGASSQDELVVQRRTDKEAAAIPGGLQRETFDWLVASPRSRRTLLLRAVEKAFAGSRRLGGRDIRVDSVLAAALARENLRFARRTLSSGSAVVTDRLHGHVISTLLGLEHCVVDDANGKIRALWDTWTHSAPRATFVPDWAGAAAWIDRRG